MHRKTIIFTDLDGTLLDAKTYSYKTTLPLIKKLKKAGIPIIFCTAKTRTENEYYGKKLEIKDPFIVENGGAIYIPKNYFGKEKCRMIKLGMPYSEIKKIIRKARKKLNCNIAGFGDFDVKSVANLTDLKPSAAKRAKQRKYSETFVIETGNEKKILRELKKAGLQIQFGGRFYDASSPKTDKGKAVKILSSLFEKEFGRIKTIGLGDSQNDLPMLKAVDLPVLIQKVSGKWSPEIKLKKIIKIKGIGPRGWKKAIKKYAL